MITFPPSNALPRFSAFRFVGGPKKQTDSSQWVLTLHAEDLEDRALLPTVLVNDESVLRLRTSLTAAGAQDSESWEVKLFKKPDPRRAYNSTGAPVLSPTRLMGKTYEPDVRRELRLAVESALEPEGLGEKDKKRHEQLRKRLLEVLA